MTSYKVTRSIEADPDTIWALLADTAKWKAWNPTIISIDGTIAEGQKVKLVSTVNPNRAFRLNVTKVDSPREMVWSDGMPLGLFKGERTYRLTPQSDGSTEFSMEEVYTGMMAPLITKSIPDMTESFGEFADGLKAAAEA